MVLFNPDDRFKILRSGHDSLKQAIMQGQKPTVTLADGIKKNPSLPPETETKLDQPTKASKVGL